MMECWRARLYAESHGLQTRAVGKCKGRLPKIHYGGDPVGKGRLLHAPVNREETVVSHLAVADAAER